MKFSKLLVIVAGMLTCTSSFSTTNQISGNIFRISYEPTGAFLSIQNTEGSIVRYNTENCGKDDIFHLPVDHLNYNVMSAVLHSHHNNNRGVVLTLDGCRYQVPVIASVEKILSY